MNLNEAEGFFEELAIKLTIKDLRSLFNAFESWPPVNQIGNNALFGSRVVIFNIKDDISDDDVIYISSLRKGVARKYSVKEIAFFYPHKDPFVYVYEEFKHLV